MERGPNGNPRSGIGALTIGGQFAIGPSPAGRPNPRSRSPQPTAPTTGATNRPSHRSAHHSGRSAPTASANPNGIGSSDRQSTRANCGFGNHPWRNQTTARSPRNSAESSTPSAPNPGISARSAPRNPTTTASGIARVGKSSRGRSARSTARLGTPAQ